MSVCASRSRPRAGALALAAALFLTGAALRAEPVAPAAPRRVVSVNVCADQLAMLLAAPGQLLSVSWLAADPRTSAMAREARHYRLNHAQAEEVFLMHPDLVLAGTWTAPATLALLARLGVPVVKVPLARSMADIPVALMQVGRALGREAAAQAEVARFDARLASLRARARSGRGDVTAALYYPNGYSPGKDTLAGAILMAAGLANIAARAGRTGAGALPLERLVMAAPDILVTTRPYPGASRAEAVLAHPALASVRSHAQVVYSGPDWSCGTPAVLGAVKALVAARQAARPTAGGGA